MLAVIAILVTAGGLWLFVSAFNEAKFKFDDVFPDEETRRFAADDYIWSPAGRPLRPKYVLGHVLLILGLALWSSLVWGTQPFMAAVFGVLGAAFAVVLTFRCLRYGL